MKKGTKIGIIITASILVLIVAAVIILSVITVKPLENLADYKIAYVYTSSEDTNSYQISSTLAGKEDKDSKLKSLLKDCSFSAIQSIFSGRTAIANVTYLEDGEVVYFGAEELSEIADEENGIDGSALGLYSKFDGTLPKLKLKFGEVKSAIIGNTEYSFDTVELLVADTHGEIMEISCVAWDSTKFEDQSETEGPEYSVVVFKIHANTTALYEFLMNVKG